MFEFDRLGQTPLFPMGVELICIKGDYQNLTVVPSKKNNKIYTDIHLFLDFKIHLFRCLLYVRQYLFKSLKYE